MSEESATVELNSTDFHNGTLTLPDSIGAALSGDLIRVTLYVGQGVVVRGPYDVVRSHDTLHDMDWPADLGPTGTLRLSARTGGRGLRIGLGA